jgi:two-component system LytT family response regulator
MTRLRILTVDDEPLALRRLKVLLQRIHQVDHVGQASGCSDALTKIEALQPDVVLLDIKMRDGSGFEVLEVLRRQSNPPNVIFVTAYDQFAVRAFDTQITDYLLKPVERERLLRALGRAEQRLALSDAEQRVEELQQIVRQLRNCPDGSAATAYQSEFWVKGSGTVVRVSVDSIECVGSEGEYIGIQTPTGKHLLRSSIRQFLEQVEPGIFAQIHRGWVVRQSSITGLCSRGPDGPEVILRSGRRLPAGRVYLRELRRRLQRPPGVATQVRSYAL